MPYNPSPTSFAGICEIIAGVSMFVALLAWPLVAIFITRKFDPYFKNITKGEMGLGCFLRGACYASNMAIPKCLMRNKKSFRIIIFGDFDLWGNATKFERSVACIHVIPGYLGLIMGVIFEINHLIFYIHNL